MGLLVVNCGSVMSLLTCSPRLQTLLSAPGSTNESALKMIINQRKEAYTNLTSSSHLKNIYCSRGGLFHRVYDFSDVHPIDAQFLNLTFWQEMLICILDFLIFLTEWNGRNLEREIARQIEEAFDDAGIENNINGNRMVQEIINFNSKGQWCCCWNGEGGTRNGCPF